MTIDKDDLARIYDAISQFSDKVAERLSILEKSVDALDQQFATMFIAFAEQAVLIEGLVTQISFNTPEARESFTKTVAAKREEMLAVIKEGGIALADNDPEVAAALEELLAERESNSTSE